MGFHSGRGRRIGGRGAFGKWRGRFVGVGEHWIRELGGGLQQRWSTIVSNGSGWWTWGFEGFFIRWREKNEKKGR